MGGADCGVVSSGSFTFGVGVAGAWAGTIGDLGAAGIDKDVCGSGGPKAVALFSVLGGSKAPNNPMVQVLQEGSNKVRSSG